MAESDRDTGTTDLGSIASLVARVADAPGMTVPQLAAGEVVAGKFRIERRLGAGGMGVVYLARDLRLEREVAVKVGAAIGPVALARVEREAIALAKLSHPNVVVIHEVGELGGRLFIAMEYVPGGTARQWLAAAPRTWREIVAMYAAAGDGLAAAHAAGLVHRDFKPDNVLVSSDGRPRVADFGLALSVDDRAGDVAGTRAYMAPEQRRGDVDARADQFAFAASVWEALFGNRPEAVASTVPAAESAEAVPVRIELPATPAARAVPRRIVGALRRALAEAPDQRWPDIGELVAELRRDPAARVRRLAIAGGVVAVAVVAAVIVTARVAGDGHAGPCTGPSELATTWNPARADQLAARFTGPGIAAIGAGVRARLDGFARAWDAGQRDACKAAHVTRSQSEATFDRRALCLASARSRLAATVAGLERADRTELAEAGDAVALLPDLSRCADVTALDAQTALPADPAKRRAIQAVIDRLATVRATATAATEGDPVAAADAVVAAARDTGWPPIIAEASWAAAAIHTARGVAGGPTYDEAIQLALAAGTDDIAAWALADFAWDTGDAEDGPTARRLGGLAQAMWQRVGKPADLGARVMGAVANAEMVVGEFTAALAATRDQVALAARAYPGDPMIPASNHYNLARALDRAGQLDDARQEADAAIAVATAVVGDDHPAVGRYRVLAGQILVSGGDHAGGLALIDAGVAVLERWFAADDVRLLPFLKTQGGVLAAVGDPRARAVLERVIRMLEPTGGVALAKTQVNLAVVEAGSGELEPALAAGASALATLDHALDPNDPDLVNTLILVGYCERGLHHLPESIAHMQRAVAIADAAYGPDGYRLINPRIELANTLVAAGQRRDAIAALAPAIALCDRDASVPPPVSAEARALWAKLGGGT